MMSLTLRWVGDDELDRVAQTRMYCYAPAEKDLERYRENIRLDQRARAGDFLLAERGSEAVGTATSLSLKMWVRGAALPCQGVAYVGTIKTHRRGAATGQRGIASQIMTETLNKARERGEIVSALMPFRASFYEHFGYGIVETRNEWTIPLSIFPSGAFEGFHFVRGEEHLSGMLQCRQRIVESGQCDIERPANTWELYRKFHEGFDVVDRDAHGVVRGWMAFLEARVENKTYVRIVDHGSDSLESFKRQMHFLASLKDQYSGVIMTLPRDVPLNWIVHESQIPHRPVEHAVPKLVGHTRMQLRILDHKRFLEPLKLAGGSVGKLTVAVHECEGDISKFQIEIADGRAHVAPTDATADIACSDKTWAAIACGELRASDAARFGLIQSNSNESAGVLDVLAAGPAPFCAEYF